MTLLDLLKATSLHQYLYLLSLLLIIYYCGKKRTWSLLLTYFLLLVLSELVVANYEVVKTGTNYRTLNIYAHLTIPLYVWIYRSSLSKRIHFFLGSLWLLVSLRLVYVEVLHNHILDTYIVGLTYVIMLIVLYVADQLNGSKYNQLFCNFRFWLGVGLLFLYVTLFPVLVFVNDLVVGSEAKSAFYYLLSIGSTIQSIGGLIAVIVLWMKD